MTEKKSIVIIGGGIIGSTTAYFLSRHAKFSSAAHTITLLEASKIAGGASGKAGGLLALWAYPSAIVPLSYRLHKELADEHGGAERWGYRAVHCGQIDARGRPLDPTARSHEIEGAGAKVNESVSLQKRTKEAMSLLKRAGVPKDLDWVDPESVDAYEEMGNPSTTAQVHPYQFTTSIAKLAEERGVKIVYGSATSIDTSPDGSVKSVTYKPKDGQDATILPATDVILSAGPWTQRVWPAAPIEALRAHSVTIRPREPVSAYALFTSISLPSNFYPDAKQLKKRHPSNVTPEIYARPNQEVYACGEGDHLIPLPATTDLVEVDLQRCQDIIDYVGSISNQIRDGEVTAKQACYLPNVSTGGGPLIGKTSTKGLVIAAGHTCWGIQNAPGTGKLVSELIFDGDVRSANIASLDPRKCGL